MAEKVLKVGMEREDGFLYYIDKDGDIAAYKWPAAAKKAASRRKLKNAASKKKKDICISWIRKAISPELKW